eukprot:4978926-Alexandrium_andersonii.AAC.1
MSPEGYCKGLSGKPAHTNFCAKLTNDHYDNTYSDGDDGGSEHGTKHDAGDATDGGYDDDGDAQAKGMSPSLVFAHGIRPSASQSHASLAT